jgi:SAM-dependent methyltransferase
MDKQIYLNMREVEDRHWWFIGRRRIVESVIQSLQLPHDADILDAGCGTGGNLGLLARYGQVAGVELDATARELANQRQLGEVLPGRLPDGLPFASGSFDLVVLLDVLEHLEDDCASLTALANLLKPGGRIVLTVPAFPLLWSPHDEAHHHKRRYRAATLRAVIERAGLETAYLSYFNTWLFPLIASVRLLQRLLPPGGSELAVPAAPVNNALTTLFASEAQLIPQARLPFGVSLLAVLKSPENA